MAQGRLVPALCGQPEVRAGRPDRAPGRASRCEFAPCLQRGRGPNRASVPRPGGVHRHGDRRKMKANEIKICRMSGTAYGTVVLHVAPEAAAGGPLGLVETGDYVILDVAARRLDVDVSADELTARKPSAALP